jgi:hypothetical protein
VPDVVNETVGILVDSEDSAAIARALDDIRRDPAAARQRAAAARERVERVYAVAPWAAAIESVYATAMR